MALSYADLLRVFGTKQRRTLERLLKAQGVKFMRDRRGRPITTDGELERAMHRSERQRNGPNLAACHRHGAELDASVAEAAGRVRRPPEEAPS
jgi:Domain of unknown function (DUF4224)